MSLDTNAAVHDQGIIKYMKIPLGWVEARAETFDTSELRFFHPANNPEAKLCFFYRGLPTESEAGARFAKVLAEPPHVLSAAEIELLYYTLGDSANELAFNLRVARTESLNGKQVMIVEGNWHKGNLDSYDIFIDVDGTGRVVQEVYFLASHVIFQKFFAEITNCLSTLAWH